MKIISFDAEFRNSQEKVMDVVSISIKDEETKEIYSRFIFKDKEAQKEVYDKFRYYIDNGYKFLVFYAGAEVRTLLSLGFTEDDILNIDWIDLYVLWSMLNQNILDCKYGLMTHKNEITGQYEYIETTKPDEEKGEVEYGEFYYDPLTGEYTECKDVKHKRFSMTLADCVMRLVKHNMNSQYKDIMRNKILTAPYFTDSDIIDILSYNKGDIRYLYPALKKALRLIKIYSGDRFTADNLKELSLFSAATGIMEKNGLPIDTEKLYNFSSNFEELYLRTIKECNDIYPFYREDILMDRKGVVREIKWVRNDKSIQTYISTLGLDDRWGKTKKGAYITSDKVLKNYTYLPPIAALYHTKWVLTMLSKFNDIKIKKDEISGGKTTSFKEYASHIGKDDRIRFLSSPFKSTTGRSQPKPSEGNIFGWSSWLRVLINSTNPDYVIIGADFSSQEIAISAVLSGDKNYIDSYNSTDPYFWLAQKSNFIDPTYQKINGKYCDKDGEVLDKDIQLNCKITRSLFKSLTLGINYGLREENLSNHLNNVLIDTLTGEDRKLYLDYKKNINTELWLERYDKIKFVSGLEKDGTHIYPKKRKASFLIELHKMYYPQYWVFRTTKVSRFERYKYEKLKDGWFSFNSINKTKNSIANFPVQGTAAVILRKSLINSLKSKLEVVASVHDALYIVSHVDNIEKNKKLLVDAMKKGAEDTLGVDMIRIDVDVYSTDWDNRKSNWVKDEDNEIFQEYFEYFVKNKKIMV